MSTQHRPTLGNCRGGAGKTISRCRRHAVSVLAETLPENKKDTERCLFAAVWRIRKERSDGIAFCRQQTRQRRPARRAVSVLAETLPENKKDTERCLFAAVWRIRKERSDGIAFCRWQTRQRRPARRAVSGLAETLPENKKDTKRCLFGADGRIRTADLFITSESLCRLSYISKIRHVQAADKGAAARRFIFISQRRVLVNKIYRFGRPRFISRRKK